MFTGLPRGCWARREGGAVVALPPGSPPLPRTRLGQEGRDVRRECAPGHIRQSEVLKHVAHGRAHGHPHLAEVLG